MDTDYIIRMANQIADALGVNPDQALAETELADHLTRFWEPRMRSALVAAVADQAQAAQLSPLVIRAIAAMRIPS
jgi:formate dehydrogenase subunit delta